MNTNFTQSRIIVFCFSTLIVFIIFDIFPDNVPVFLVLVACFAILCFFEDDEARVKRAKADADIALFNQKARLARKDHPPEVAGQIALMQAEAEIKYWAEQKNADKVLEFTKKKHELEKELRG
jgi:hypothetical protein